MNEQEAQNVGIEFHSGWVQGYSTGYSTGYAAAKAEMIGKLTEFRPTYVEGGRVPEDAIEHRNQPKFRDTIDTKGK